MSTLLLVGGFGITKFGFQPGNGGFVAADEVVGAFSSFFFKYSAFLAAASSSENWHSL